ncbi:MAG: hypothetical protein QM831_13310 [Kofleriaceae bacterium]
MRRFENSAGRFWQIEPYSGVLTIKWGQIGEVGQRREVENAPGKLEQMIAQQIALGYREVVDENVLLQTLTSEGRWFAKIANAEHSLAIAHEASRVWIWRDDEPAGSPTEYWTLTEIRHHIAEELRAGFSRGMTWVQDAHDPEAITQFAENPELEAQCEAAPDDPAPWTVLADWLSERGDPRGSLAALFAARRKREAERELEARGYQLFGTYANEIRITEWRHGFATAALVVRGEDSELSEVVSRFVRMPIARFVDNLQVGVASHLHNDWAPTLRVLRVAKHPLRRLVLGEADQRNGPDAQITGDISIAFRLAGLEHLTVNAVASELSPIDARALKSFTLTSTRMLTTHLSSIIAGQWPMLERLELHIGGDAHGRELQSETFARLFATKFPALRHLAIRACHTTGEVLDAIVRSPLLPQLRTLALVNGVAQHPEAAFVLSHLNDFKHLDELDLEMNYLSADDVQALHRALPGFRSGSMRNPNLRSSYDWRFAPINN